jgi:hypothetical protein
VRRAYATQLAKYVTELKEGGDIRSVTLGQLASHTSGLERTPHQSEPWHRGPYTLPDFTRYLNAWKADEAHTPGKQDIYSNSGFVLLALDDPVGQARVAVQSILFARNLAKSDAPPASPGVTAYADRWHGHC